MFSMKAMLYAYCTVQHTATAGIRVYNTVESIHTSESININQICINMYSLARLPWTRSGAY